MRWEPRASTAPYRSICSSRISSKAEKSVERQLAIQEMIVDESPEARRMALDKLLPYQRRDFVGIFKAMDGFPVTIRLIDPPLHEFVPHDLEKQQELARKILASMWRSSPAASSNCTRQTRCSATGDPGWPSRIRKFWRCRFELLLKRPSKCKKGGFKVLPEIKDSTRDGVGSVELQILSPMQRIESLCMRSFLNLE